MVSFGGLWQEAGSECFLYCAIGEGTCVTPNVVLHKVLFDVNLDQRLFRAVKLILLDLRIVQQIFLVYKLGTEFTERIFSKESVR